MLGVMWSPKIYHSDDWFLLNELHGAEPHRQTQGLPTATLSIQELDVDFRVETEASWEVEWRHYVITACDHPKLNVVDWMFGLHHSEYVLRWKVTNGFFLVKRTDALVAGSLMDK